MIISCPNCDARFRVDAAKIPEEGRQLRCSNCRHEWHFTPAYELGELVSEAQASGSDFAVDDQESDDAQTSSNLGYQASDEDESAAENTSFAEQPFTFEMPGRPTATATSAPAWPYVAAGGLLLLVALFLLSGLYLRHDVPVVAAIYRLIGHEATDGLVLTQMQAEARGQTEHKKEFIITGRILNQSTAPRQLSALRIRLVSADNETILEQEYPVIDRKSNEPVRLAAQDSYPFRVRLQTNRASSVSSIQIDLGNGFELMLR